MWGATLAADRTQSDGAVRFRIPFWVLRGGSPVQEGIGREDLRFSVGSAERKIASHAEPGTETLLFLAFDLVGDLGHYPVVQPSRL